MKHTPYTPKMTDWECPGKDGTDWVISAPDQHGKRRTLAHVYEEPHARLIAAAPDLLAALNDVLVGTAWHHIEPTALDQAKAAIAKAQGATQMKVTDLDTGDYYYAADGFHCRPQHDEAFREANYQNTTINNIRFERYEPTH